MTISSNLATEERLSWMTEQLHVEGSLRISPAAKELRVSEMTVRRDLNELEALGVARRVRGGAVAVGPLSFADRHRHRARAKARIAAKLAELIPATGAIGLDASSTLLRLASTIVGRDLTVLTNGPETFQALQGKPGLTAVITGGQLDSRTGSLVGPLACRAAASLLLTRLFVSADAVNVEVGPSEPCIEEAEVKRALGAVAAEVVLAVDSSKLDTRSVAVGVTWDHITTMVTELEPTDRRLERYRELVTVL